MIKTYLKSFEGLVTRGSTIAIGAAFLMALAIYDFLITVVEGLVAPAVAALFGKPDIYLLDFTINGSAFQYGSVLVGLILLALVFVVVALIGKARQDAEARSTEA
jgi:large conductance mechanosensitive channel